MSIGKSSCAPYLCFRELHTQSAPKVTNYKWKHYHDNWLSLLMGWWKYLCNYISVCAPLSCSSAGSGVDNVPFPQSREHSLLTEISAAMAWGMFGVDSAAPGELMRGQVVAGAHCSRSYLHLGGLGKTLLLPHLHICWVLSTGSCSMQRAHRSVHGCPGLKAFQPFLVSWWQRLSLHCWAGAGFPWSRGEVIWCCPNDLQAWLEARRGQPVCHWAST